MQHIFVFGSNYAGRHGKGAARYAYKLYGAKWGIGEGPTGSAYAIPTKDFQLRPLPILSIKEAVTRFLQYAKSARHLEFFVTKVGCGLAGYSSAEIAPLFAGAPANCIFDPEWRSFGFRVWSWDEYRQSQRYPQSVSAI